MSIMDNPVAEARKIMGSLSYGMSPEEKIPHLEAAVEQLEIAVHQMRGGTPKEYAQERANRLGLRIEKLLSEVVGLITDVQEAV